MQITQKQAAAAFDEWTRRALANREDYEARIRPGQGAECAAHLFEIAKELEDAGSIRR